MLVYETCGVTEYYSVTLFELTFSGGCTDVFEAVELMLSVVFNRSSSLVQKLFVFFFVGTGRVIYRWKALDNHISSILNIFVKSSWFKSSFEKTVFFKTENVNRILNSIFKWFVRIEQIRWRWKAGENPHLPYMYCFF